MRFRRLKLVVAIALAAVSVSAMGGCGGGSERGGETGTTAAPSQQSKGGATNLSGTQVGALLNVIVAECERRRQRGSRAGRTSQRFDRALDRLVLQFDRTPDEPVRLRDKGPDTTLRAVLVRIGTTLQQAAPQGCGDPRHRRGGTGAQRSQIRRALREHPAREG